MDLYLFSGPRMERAYSHRELRLLPGQSCTYTPPERHIRQQAVAGDIPEAHLYTMCPASLMERLLYLGFEVTYCTRLYWMLLVLVRGRRCLRGHKGYIRKGQGQKEGGQVSRHAKSVDVTLLARE